MLSKLIGHNIRSIRKSKGITATFMARELGYKSVSSYIRLESGETPITLEKGKVIADLLMVNINYFFENNLRDLHSERKIG